MRKILLILSTIVAVFILILVGALLTLHYWFNPNTLLKPLSQQIEQKTGFVLHVDGALRWHLFPRTSIVVEQLSLTTTNPKQSVNNLSLKSLSVDLKLWPLVTQKKLIVNEIDLDGLNTSINSNAVKQNVSLSPRAIPVVFSAALQENINHSNQKIHFDVNNIYITNAIIQKTSDTANEQTTFYIDQFTVRNLNSDKTSVTVPIDLNARIDHQGNLYPIYLHSELAIDKNKQTLQANHLQMRLNTLQLEGNLNASNIATIPQYQGQLTLTDNNLANTLHLFLNKTVTAPKMLQSKFDVHGDSKQVTLFNLNLKLDGQIILGFLQYNIKQNHLNAALNAGTLYWPTTPNNRTHDASTLVQPTALKVSTTTLNSSGQFSLDSQIQVQHFVYNTLALDNVNTQLHYDGQTFTFDPLVVSVLQGLYQGKIQWTPNNQQLQVSGALSHLDLARLQAYLGRNPSLTGSLDAKGTLNTAGSDSPSILAHLNGHVWMSITQGTWTHLNMPNILSFLNAAGKHGSTSSNDTFSAATGNFNIRDGFASNPDLKLISPLLKLTGKGSLDLRARTMDYRMQLSPDTIVLGQVKGLSKWLKKDIPLIVTGPWDNPKIAVDPTALIRTEVQDQLDNTLGDTVKSVRKLILIR